MPNPACLVNFNDFAVDADYGPFTARRARKATNERTKDIRNSDLCDFSRGDEFPSCFGANRPSRRAFAYRQ
jgi:hypothetical protein